jgi:hypothetical protein
MLLCGAPHTFGNIRHQLSLLLIPSAEKALLFCTAAMLHKHHARPRYAHAHAHPMANASIGLQRTVGLCCRMFDYYRRQQRYFAER